MLRLAGTDAIFAVAVLQVRDDLSIQRPLVSFLDSQS